MKSKLFENYGGFKVWERPLNRGKGFRYEVRNGNKVLLCTHSLFEAMNDAKARMDAFWNEQARVMAEMKKAAR